MDKPTSLNNLQEFIESESFKGYDPYDALNSPFLNIFSFKNKYIRIAFIQGLKRLPVNIRSLLGITKNYNPKGLGLILWGYAKLYSVKKKPEYLQKIDHLIGLLYSLKSPNCSGTGWGYNFDWQSRAFFIPKYTPTIVNSAFIGHALLDTFKLTGNNKALDLAMPIRDFIMNDLNRKEENGTICFSYTPADNYYVHNANLLGASILIRLHKEISESDLKEPALSALNYSIKHQRKDGSWYYAEKEGSHWIDSFHTGFNLQAIKYLLDEGNAQEYQQAFEKGVKFYAENFFLKDGTPKYYHDRLYPIDIHCPAQAIVFFSEMGPKYKELTEKILNWFIQNMQSPKGCFYFQKNRFSTNKIAYMRWSQAWAFHALTEYFYSYGLNHE